MNQSAAIIQRAPNEESKKMQIPWIDGKKKGNPLNLPWSHTEIDKICEFLFEFFHCEWISIPYLTCLSVLMKTARVEEPS